MEPNAVRRNMENVAGEMLGFYFNLQPSIDGRIVPVGNQRSNTRNNLNSTFQRNYRLATGEMRTPLRPVLVEVVDGTAKRLGYELKPVFWRRNDGFSEVPYYEGQNPMGHYWVRSN